MNPSKAKPKRGMSVSQYDKVIKENLDRSFPTFIKELFLLNDIIATETLPFDMQRTRERRPDQLLKILRQSTGWNILHAEYQTTNDPTMLYRMLDYCVQLVRKFGLPVLQYVVYIGREPLSMKYQLELGNLSFSFHVIDIAKVHYRIFLEKDQPEEVIFAILCNFGDDTPEAAVQRIYEKLQSVTPTELEFSRRCEQLLILSALRQLTSNIEHIMATITRFFNPETNYFVKEGEARGEAIGEARGEARGEAKAKLKLALKMLNENILPVALPIETIAALAEIPVEELLAAKAKADQEKV